MPNQFSSVTTEERFWAQVQRGCDVESCWLWVGYKQRQGYGRFKVHNRPKAAHRVSYELVVGPIPDGMTLDHLCRVPACVNPKHLEVVSIRVNTLRGVGPTALNAVKTHCSHGHEYTPENTHTDSKGSRYCLACRRLRYAKAS